MGSILSITEDSIGVPLELILDYPEKFAFIKLLNN